jgi:hypothetical protein
MRFIINGLIALMVLGLLAGVMYHRDVQQQQQRLLDDTRDDVRRLAREIMLQATLRQVELTEAGYPKTVDPRWFEDDLPSNGLIIGPHPWVEVAHEDHRLLAHPPVKIAADQSMARFWYNPYNGVVRARVPVAMSEVAALRLYNHINDANLDTLYESDAGDSLLLR